MAVDDDQLELRRVLLTDGRIVLVDADDPNDDATIREALDGHHD